jgi:uncharacterized protein (DUF2225 family)
MPTKVTTSEKIECNLCIAEFKKKRLFSTKILVINWANFNNHV